MADHIDAVLRRSLMVARHRRYRPRPTIRALLVDQWKTSFRRQSISPSLRAGVSTFPEPETPAAQRFGIQWCNLLADRRGLDISRPAGASQLMSGRHF